MTNLPPADLAKNQVEYWKQVVGVLTHFNDMCIRTRWFGLTVITTLFAGAALAMGQENPGYLDILSVHIPISSILFALAAMVCIALWQLDEKYYFKMLMASVEHAEEIEPAIQNATGGMIPGLTLTRQISEKVSRERAQSIARWFYGAPFTVSSVLFLLSFAYHAAGHANQTPSAPGATQSDNQERSPPPASPETTSPQEATKGGAPASATSTTPP